MKLTPRDTALATFAALIWGATFPISAIALGETSPIFFTFLRFLFAASFIMVIPRPKMTWAKLVLLGIVLGVGQYGSMFVAISQGMPAGVAAVLVHTQAIFTVLLAIIFLNERPEMRTFITLLLASLGLVCLALDLAQGGILVGFVLMIVAALSAALGNVILKTAGKVEMLSVAVWMSLGPLIPLALLGAYLEGVPSLFLSLQNVTLMTLAAAGYSAVFATVVVYTIWGRLLVTYSTGQVAPFFLLVPVFSLGMSAWVLGEQLSGLQLSGSVLILLGLITSILPKRRGVI
ncbi:EamA family transporter [Octadecabacter sp.]|nr:EamA family transporter [Octadecabacter sp.]